MTYNFRLYLNSEQKVLIHKIFGCVILVYNHFLDKCIKDGYIKAFDMCKDLKDFYVEIMFLKEKDSWSLNSIELDSLGHQIKLPKLGLINIRRYRNLEMINGRIVNATKKI